MVFHPAAEVMRKGKMADEEIVSRANDMNISASSKNRRELAD
jgi:hypothetical protein